jgi:hypothetical protein
MEALHDLVGSIRLLSDLRMVLMTVERVEDGFEAVQDVDAL